MDLSLLFPGSIVFVPGMMDAPTSSCVLLVEDSKKILVDPGGFPSIKILEERLTSMGLSPDSITDILLTHFHLDHAFNSMFFPHATIRLHANYQSRNYGSFGPVVGAMYLKIIDSWRRVEPFNGGEKILGSIDVLKSPFHSRDHVSFFLETENHGKVFICGDVCTRQINYHEIRKGMRSDAAAAFVTKYFEMADTVIFSHDLPLFKR
ncbi:MAG TPA: MBL fold metallo-hydrolase [Mesotoga infera]|uniref:Metallo-beta-lactamase domain-containing protein 1 n=1 Tax=Mesotoga infera TaxID=1236046 RepID=A0A7C1GQE1_9BACT|nr:MBL fold metallo-hydrolase [Mesotoga infera]